MALFWMAIRWFVVNAQISCFHCGHLVLGTASGLEAFSREPPCNSVGALAARQTPETRGMAGEFLSYYPLLPSRHLRDPFTISFPTWFSFLAAGTEYLRASGGPKATPYFALREHFSQFPAK
jgi:hypothetical protein